MAGVGCDRSSASEGGQRSNPVERLPRSMPPDSVDHHIVLLEHELERVIDLPTTPSHLRARLIERLAALKARAGTQQSQR